MKRFIPEFQNIETAAQWAAQNEPFKAAMTFTKSQTEEYRDTYGENAAQAVVNARVAIEIGDTHSAGIATRALSWSLFSAHPELFEDRKARSDEYRRAA